VTQDLSENLPDFELTRLEGIQSIFTLINLIPDPAIIYQREEDQILSANNPLYLLTNLGENDFIGQPIKTLLPNLTETDPIIGHDKKAFLRHKKQPLIPVNVRIFNLTKTANILLIVLNPQELTQFIRHRASEQSEIIESLLSIMENESGHDLNGALQQILEKSCSILKADFTCVYKFDSNLTNLRLFLSFDKQKEDIFPKFLSDVDLKSNQFPMLWTPDRPVVTDLQKVAANHALKFLAIAPLGSETSKSGLFVAAGKDLNYDQNTLPLTRLIASYLTGLLESQIALSQSRNLARRIKQVVQIQNEIISNLEEGTIILSPDLTIAELNPAAEAILGYANREALRQHIDSILIGSESLGSAFSSAQEGFPTLTGGDLTLHHRTGKSFPAQVMVTPVLSNDQLLSIIVIIRDLSQQEQHQAANKQLEQRAILGEVTAIFAHEVRNPINAIMLSLQVLEDNLAEDDQNMKWIQNMRDECNKLMYLMESVLSFAKPLEYKMSGVDLDFLITRILERWHPRLVRLNIGSYYESSVENPIVEGDLRALEQVFTNVISNAVNAMSEKGGSLGIKITQPERAEDHNFYQITLTDTGHGIPDEIRAHMFKPFVTGSQHGTGLGLAITQRIVNAHKGKIEVDSFAGGTIFKIYLVKVKGLNNR
jgi:PAS domain S-box-containing protein